MSLDQQLDEGAAEFQRGEYQKAEQTLSGVVRELKDNDKAKPEFASALEWLGRAQTWLGKLDESEMNLKESRQIRELSDGADSKAVAFVDLYLSDLNMLNENFKPAHDLAQSSFAIIEKESPAFDLSIADAAERVGLAGAHLDGKFEESEAYLNKALGIRRKKLGEDHPLVGKTLDELSQCHALAQNFTMAGALGRKALAIKEAALGPDHPEVGVTLYNLSTQYVSTQMFQRATKVARRGAEVLSKLPDDNAVNIRMKERLAATCIANGELDEALELNKKALASAERVWGTSDSNIVSNLIGLGSTYLHRKEFENAEFYFKRSLSVLEGSTQLEASQEYVLLQNLFWSYLFQLKVGDTLALIPSTERARHIANYGSTIDLVRAIIGHIGKQVKEYKDER
ncbi:MAG: tetratricopeptide repeat protein [Candidatus Melainabacteria bacterium]|nr:tetratricopeptide repeat protein [Candidatus Melainabacteria bacterium]